MHTVAVAVLEQAPIFELAVPCEVFGRDRSDLATPWYGFALCAPAPTRTACGFLVGEPQGLEMLAAEAGTVIVPPSGDIDGPGSPELLEALRAAHARGARIASICEGAFMLAEAGLLGGRRATTHWIYATEFARRFPEVNVDPDVLYVDEGDVLSSAGTAAGIDLCLHIVRRDFGAGVANAIARRLVVPPHREGGQAQFVQAPVQLTDGDGLAPVLDWARAHLDKPLTVADLARRAATSPRTFNRRFRAATGGTPLRWLTGERVRVAAQLLEETDEPVERVAERCGFGTPANLRQHFSRATGVSPQTYRKTFQAA